MGEYRDFLRYVLISLFVLAAMIVFWNLLVTYLGDVAVVLYRYEGALVFTMLLCVGFLSASALYLEPKKFLVFPVRWIRIRLNRESRRRD
jgi:hypothetical protein